MNLQQLISQIEAMMFEMDNSIENITMVADRTQNLIYDLLLEEINNFEIQSGKFVLGQPFSRRISTVERKMQEILGETYSHSVKEYLNTFSTVEKMNMSLQKDYNDLLVDLKLISPARQSVFNQAQYFLTEAIQPVYIQPVKFLLMQQVTSGISIKDSQRILRSWNDGNSEEKLVTIRPTPTLGRYVNQISRDSIYKFNSAINGIIQKEYGLNKFIYVGGTVKDSRPLCRHLVSLRRKIAIDEMPDLIKKFPRGLYPNTTEENFIEVCGGYGCMHTATPVYD